MTLPAYDFETRVDPELPLIVAVTGLEHLLAAGAPGIHLRTRLRSYMRSFQGAPFTPEMRVLARAGIDGILKRWAIDYKVSLDG